MDESYLRRIWQACKEKATHDFLRTLPKRVSDQHVTCVVAPAFQDARIVARACDAKDTAVYAYTEDAVGWCV